jgi:hypothetical protein
MTKLKLRAIIDGKDSNQYCGPSVISALTDLTTGEAARLIRMQNGRRTIRGSYTHEVLDALRACNIKATRWQKLGVRLNRTTGPTLAGWLKMSKADRTPGRVFLLVAGWHWQLVSGRRYTCGRIREIVSIKDKRVKRRARVYEVHELTSDNVTKPEIDVSKPKPKPKPKTLTIDFGERKPSPAYYAAQAAVRKLIKQHPEFGFRNEREDGIYYISMSPALEDLAAKLNHPLCDNHYCDRIEAVRDRLEEMVEFAKKHHSKIVSQ